MAQPIEPRKDAIAAAATPANTPLNVAPISRGEGLPKPSVATVEEDDDDDSDAEDLAGGNPASVLARVSFVFRESGWLVQGLCCVKGVCAVQGLFARGSCICCSWSSPVD